MDCYKPTNRSTSAFGTGSPVVFSEEYGNIKNATYNTNNKDWRNVAYMNWSSGASTYSTAVGDVTNGATVGFNRKEIIIDSSKVNQTEVTHEGWSELHKRPVIESFTAEIINNPNTMTTYLKDWFLGDIVTIQSKEMGVTVDAQITEITETYADGLYSLEATFNEGQPNLIQLIKQEINRRKI